MMNADISDTAATKLNINTQQKIQNHNLIVNRIILFGLSFYQTNPCL